MKEIILNSYKPKVIFYYRSDKSYLYSLYVQQLTQRKSISIDNISSLNLKLLNIIILIKNKYYFMSQTIILIIKELLQIEKNF